MSSRVRHRARKRRRVDRRDAPLGEVHRLHAPELLLALVECAYVDAVRARVSAALDVGELGARAAEPVDNALLGVAVLRADIADPGDDVLLGIAELGAHVVEVGGDAVAHVRELSACVADAAEHPLAGVAVLRTQVT